MLQSYALNLDSTRFYLSCVMNHKPPSIETKAFMHVKKVRPYRMGIPHNCAMLVRRKNVESIKRHRDKITDENSNDSSHKSGTTLPPDRNRNLRLGFIHPDLGIGGAEQLIVLAAVGLQSNQGYTVEIITAHHDVKHCFEPTRNG